MLSTVDSNNTPSFLNKSAHQLLSLLQQLHHLRQIAHRLSSLPNKQQLIRILWPILSKSVALAQANGQPIPRSP